MSMVSGKRVGNSAILDCDGAVIVFIDAQPEFGASVASIVLPTLLENVLTLANGAHARCGVLGVA